MDLFVVSHTHWDREWYQPAARFRQRLVPLVDELLDPSGETAPSFLLDGQAIVVEDYLAVRPGRRQAVSAALADGRLEAGPWYVLADSLIPGGESHVRNLLAGRAVLSRLGATAPPVLYSPDAFGHAAAIPRLAHGFGLPVAVVWRGYGGARWPAGDSVWWEAEGGERVLLHHLAPDGYELGANLPSDPDEARQRWERLRAILAPRARLGLAFLPNGADHHALQYDAAAAMAALAEAAAPATVVRWTSLREFALTLAERAAAQERRQVGEGEDRKRKQPTGEVPGPLPVVSGELRDSYGYTWTLQGTLATRAGQKRRAARAERLLVRDVEPWLALAPAGNEDGTRALLSAAWRTLLRCQPHDTLCGCSLDDVARTMDARLRSVRTQAAGLRSLAIQQLAGHDPVAAREQRALWRSTLLVRNAAPRLRGGVAEVELLSFIADVPVGPRSANAPVISIPRADHSPVTLDGGNVLLQPLRSRIAYDLVESSRNYPDCDLVRRTSALAWLPPQEGYGVRGYDVAGVGAGAIPAAPPAEARGGEGWLDNGRLRMEILPDGAVDLLVAGRRMYDILALETVGDRGDCYTHSPVGERRLQTRPDGMRLLASGPLRATIALDFEPSLPVRRTRAGGVARLVGCPVTVELSLDAGSDVLRLVLSGRNKASDHRLRLVIRTDVAPGQIWADAAFGPLLREPLEVPPEDCRAEQPPPTAPLHRYVSRYASDRGVTLFSDGLAEYEAAADGSLAVTLVRAVGQLSRADLPERPGHAGWPAATPAAQSRGRFGALFGLMLHGPRDAGTVDLIERAADDLLLPLRGETLRSSLATPGQAGGITLDGVGLAMSAIKPADDPDWLIALRCVNLLDRSVDGSWTLAMSVAEARRARLDETPGEPLGLVRTEAGRTQVDFVAGPRAVVTILVR